LKARSERLEMIIYLMMDKNTKENGLKIREMVEESIFGQMGKDMMDFGKMINLMNLAF